MTLSTVAAVLFPAHIAAPPPLSAPAPLVRVVYCGDGYDLDLHGRCLPNGVIPPQFQAARQGYMSGRHPVPCGDGADLDIRDNRCYPTGTVPKRFQTSRVIQRYRRHHW